MIFEKIRVVIVEDEHASREKLIEELREFEEFEFVGEAHSVQSTFDIICKTHPEIIFLDMKLKGGDAIGVLNRLKRHSIPIPYLVITTSFPDYMAKVFNDYQEYLIRFISKPIENYQNEFQEVIDKLRIVTSKVNASIIETKEENLRREYLPIQKTHGNFRVDFSDITYLEADGKYNNIYTIKGEKHLISMTLNQMIENELPSYFVRISKFHAVNLKLYNGFSTKDDTNTISIQYVENPLNIGSVYFKDLKKALDVLK